MKSRNSWRNLETAVEKRTAEEVPQTETSISMVGKKKLEKLEVENMKPLKAIKYAKDKVKKIKEHETVITFCGDLTLPQQILFGITLTMWIVFNTIIIINMLLQVFGEQNVKTVTSEIPLQEENNLPNIGLMACAATTKYLYDVGMVGNLSAISTFYDSNGHDSNSLLECKTFTSKSKFNDYNEGFPVRCCGLTLPRHIYELPEGISSMQQNTVQQRILLKAKNTEFAGIFLHELQSGETALDALDPSLHFKVDGRVQFNTVQGCGKEQATTDLIERRSNTYYALKFTKTKHEEELIWKRQPDAVDAALREITDQSILHIHKNYTCNNEYAILPEVTWMVAFLGAFQPTTITLNEKKSVITLSAGAGSAFGLMNTTMLIWTLLFPVVSKKNPGIRKVHQCFGKYCCKSWRWEEE